MKRKRSRGRRFAWLAASAVLLLGAWMWFFYEVATPRLGSQNELEGLMAPVGLNWDDSTHVDSLLVALAEALVARPANAGVSIGVIKNGIRRVVSRGVKSKNDPGGPVSRETLFELGSITKTFTGVMLAQADMDGHLSLEQPIGALLPPSIHFPESVKSIPVGALATHSAGLPRNPPSLSFFARTFRKNPVGRVTDRQAFEDLAKIEVEGPAGRKYEYSNFGFMLLGRLIQEATGMDYGRSIARLTDSLGMSSTWVEPPESVLSRLAVGHRVGKPVEHWYEVPLPGAQGVVSTVPDMLTYLEAHLDPEGTPLTEALTAAMEPRMRASETVEVGLGWQLYTFPGVPLIIYHHGSTMGFRSYIGMAPELGLGIVVLGNSRDPTISAIGRLIMRTLARIEE